jgi:hypothetical protein
LRYSRRCPSGTFQRAPDILSQALAPLQSFTSTSPQSTVASRRHPALAPSEVWSPSAFLNHEELYREARPRRIPTRRAFTPSGTLTLSTSCSPRDLLGLFHPRSALGVNPTRPYSSHDAVRLLRRRAPRGLPLPQLTARLPTGTHTPQKAPNQTWELARLLLRVPPWAYPLRGLLPVTDGRTDKSLPSPLALS